MLSDNAQFLHGLGRESIDVSELFAFEFLPTNGLSPMPVLASEVDGFMPSPGISLSYGRSFGNTIAERHTLRPYGRGWQAPALARLQPSEDGTVNVFEGQSHVRRFQPDMRQDGDYITALGDSGTLHRLATGGYRLVEVSGLTRSFDKDGILQSTENRDGNRISYSYTGGRLRAMTHSSGARLDFTYNADGFLASISDSTGWVTTFKYDVSTKELISATSPSGTTRYTYAELFEYDEAGYLVASVDATGARHESRWSDQGQYLGGKDRALNEFRFEPGGPFGQALSFADAKVR